MLKRLRRSQTLRRGVQLESSRIGYHHQMRHARLINVGGHNQGTNTAMASLSSSSSSSQNSSSHQGKSTSSPPCPYPIEGGHVPIWSVGSGGRIQKRNWVYMNENWCDLCKEPVSLWVNHHGRKDHALMDLHYSALVEYPRNWNPELLLSVALEEVGVPMESYLGKYGYYDVERRAQIFALVSELEDAGVISLGDQKRTFLFRLQGGMRGMDHQGALVMHEFVQTQFLRLYPDGQIQDLSNLTDFITCSYNMETVYDLCGFYKLDKLSAKEMKPSSPAALGLGGIASSSSASHGYTKDEGVGGASKIESDAESAEAFSRKAQFIRGLLGQLRWVISEEMEHPQGKQFEEYLILMSKILLKTLVTEIVACRVCEYMVRSEPVWRQHGFERKKLNVPERFLDQLHKDGKHIAPSNRVNATYRPLQHHDLDDYYHVDVEEYLNRKLSAASKGIDDPFSGEDEPKGR